MTNKVPHFSTFGKNYTRRFKDTDLFEQIFAHILEECYKFKLVDPTEIFAYAVETACDKNGWILGYTVSPGNLHSTTNRDGYREYKSCGNVCENCSYLSQCTESKNHVKLITRHIWENYMEQCEDVRHTLGMKKLYEQRKETIERIFGTAKENHGFRYTQMYGKARMEMKVGLTFACMNLKKLAMMLQKSGRKGYLISTFLSFWANNCCKKRVLLKIFNSLFNL